MFEEYRVGRIVTVLVSFIVVASLFIWGVYHSQKTETPESSLADIEAMKKKMADAKILSGLIDRARAAPPPTTQDISRIVSELNAAALKASTTIKK